MTVRRENLLIVLGATWLVAALYFTASPLSQAIDYVLYYQPNFQFLIDAVHTGRAPLWNPYIGLGRPYLADIQNAVFYPPLYLLLLGPVTGLALLVWLHTLLAVFGLRTLGRALGLTRGISVLIAFAYVASVALTGRMQAGQLLYVFAAGYLPWLLWISAETGDPLSPRRIATHAGLLALQFLCGHPQIFWLTGIAQAVVLVTLSVHTSARESLRRLGSGLGGLALAGSLAFGLVAVVLLPFLELVRQGNRTEPSLAFASYGKLAWPELLTLFLRSPYPHLVDWERHLFIGLPLAMTGLAGLFHVRDVRGRLFIALAVTGLFLALADSTLAGVFFYKLLPGYSVFRLHTRAGLLIVVALLLAAGFWLSTAKSTRSDFPGLGAAAAAILGLILFFAPEAQQGFPPASTPALFAITTAILLGIWLTARARRLRLTPWVLGAIVALELVQLAVENHRVKQAYSFSGALRSTGQHPVETVMTRALESAGLLAPGLPPPRVLADQQVIPSNLAMLHHYASVDAYTSLFLGRPWKFLHGVSGVAEDSNRNTAIAAGIAARGAFPIPGFHQVVGLDPARHLLQIQTNPPPRAFVVFDAKAVGGIGEAIHRLRSGHDIYRTALLDESPDIPTLMEPPPAVPAVIRRFEENRLWLEMDIPRAGWLVLAEAWYPGWNLRMGDRFVESVPANVWMRAFPVPAGKYSAEVVFHQNWLVPGAVISAASFVLMIGLLRRGGIKAAVQPP